MKKSKEMVYAGIIACLYAILTMMPGLNSFSYGPVQFRVSEALTALALLTPAAIPGLTVGCVIANLSSPMMALDIPFGGTATFLAACFMYKLHKNKKIALAMPAVFNGIIIGSMISLFYAGSNISVQIFIYNIITVAAGELAVCYLLGYPLAKMLEKYKIFKN